MIADLTCGHEHMVGAAIGNGDGREFGVHATVASADQPAALVVGPPLF